MTRLLFYCFLLGLPLIGHANQFKHISYEYVALKPGDVQYISNIASNLDNKDYPAFNTYFDLASLTKIFTAVAILKSVQDGKISLEVEISSYLAELKLSPVGHLSIKKLLLHQTGLPSGFNHHAYSQINQALLLEQLLTFKLAGEKFKYSDVGYIVLGFILERVYAKSLDKIIQDIILKPMKLTEIKFQNDLRQSDLVFPTRIQSDKKVHDPTCYKMGGVCGHAGLFATIKSLHRFFASFLNCDQHPILNPSMCFALTREYDQGRAQGFDVSSAYSVPLRGDYFIAGEGFGHSGYTGTSVWIEPSQGKMLLLLSNRVYPFDSELSKQWIRNLRIDLANWLAIW